MTRREDYLGYRVSERGKPNYYSREIPSEVANRTPPSLLGEFRINIHKIFADAERLLLKKHESYGPTNIANAPGGPENGLRVRMHDKMARLNHILENPSVDVNDESLEDTLTDLLNYCAIFIMVRRNQWPSK